MSEAFPPGDLAGVETAWRHAIASGAAVLRHATIRRLPGSAGAWTDSGIEVATGETVTLLGRGTVWLSRAAGVGFGPKVALWYRIGDGPIARCVADTDSFVADRSGALHLIAKPPGEWADAFGRFLPDYPPGGAEGGLLVAALVWSGDVARGLVQFAAGDASGAAAAEARRRASERPLPRGWRPLWRVGETSLFAEGADDAAGRCIECRCEDDAAILKYAVDVPLDEGVRFAWSWCVDRLPSAAAENTLATHDYLSTAVEFDNGQDLTYFWSSTLPPGTAFRCPIAWWDRHETHVVCRSGAEGLGRWIDEERPVLADYRRAIGGADPQRIVGVWLIALSPFQHGLGEARFRALRIAGTGRSLWIGP